MVKKLLLYWNKTFIIGENITKYWFPIKTNDRFITFITNSGVQK